MTQRTVTAITRDGDSVTIHYQGGESTTFESFADLQQMLAELDTPVVCEQLIIAYWLARSADGSNTQVAIGTFTLDPGAANFFRKQ